MTFRTTAILRGFDPDTTCDLAQRAWAAGVDLVEVPVQAVDAWDSLAAVAALSGRGQLGAGTVLTPTQVRRAEDHGCTVIISPGLDPAVVEATLTAGLHPLPGAFTPSEVMLAQRLGLSTVKLFPASFGGPGYLRSLLAPFPDMRFVAVGGVDAANAHDFVQAGAAGVAFGSSITDLLAGPDPSAVVAQIHSLLA